MKVEKGIVVSGDEDRTVVRIANHGSESRATVAVGGGVEDPYYSRIEYSTASGPVAIANVRSGTFTIDTPFGPAGRGSLSPEASGARWASSSSSLRVDRASDSAPDGWELLKASWERKGERAHLASVASGRWTVHVLRLPAARDLRRDRCACAARPIASSAPPRCGNRPRR